MPKVPLLFGGTLSILLAACGQVSLFGTMKADESAGPFHGAIYTSLKDGGTVNQNLYAAKADVYLNGGPQNENANGLPDGTYYFQVTDPSGATLLSEDDAVCRQVVVTGGVI